MHGIELLVVTQEEDVYIFSVLQLLSPSSGRSCMAKVIYYKSQCPFDTARNYSSPAKRPLNV